MSERRSRVRPLARLAAAVAFLTRVPVGARAGATTTDLADAAPLFPVVGAALGALVGAVVSALEGPLSPLLAATLAVAFEQALTGGLHLDGLADTADALGGRDPTRRLAIMRDHSLGTYGVTALVLDLLTKVAALAALAGGTAVLPTLAAFAVSRAAPLPLAAALPYARPGPGTGRSLAESLGASRALLAVAIAVVLAGGAVGWEAAAALGALALVVLALGIYSHRALGGVTGDVMGASIELTATLALVVAAAW